MKIGFIKFGVINIGVTKIDMKIDMKIDVDIDM